MHHLTKCATTMRSTSAMHLDQHIISQHGACVHSMQQTSCATAHATHARAHAHPLTPWMYASMHAGLLAMQVCYSLPCTSSAQSSLPGCSAVPNPFMLEPSVPSLRNQSTHALPPTTLTFTSS